MIIFFVQFYEEKKIYTLSVTILFSQILKFKTLKNTKIDIISTDIVTMKKIYDLENKTQQLEVR